MEPISAFFILEGILMDMVGGYLIVSGILNVSIPISSNLQTMQKDYQGLFDDSVENLSSLNTLMTLYDSRKKEGAVISQDLRNRYELLVKNATRDSFRTLTEATAQLNSLSLYLFSFLHQTNQFKVRQGLPFLLGGFLLQGIGVLSVF